MFTVWLLAISFFIDRSAIFMSDAWHPTPFSTYLWKAVICLIKVERMCYILGRGAMGFNFNPFHWILVLEWGRIILVGYYSMLILLLFVNSLPFCSKLHVLGGKISTVADHHAVSRSNEKWMPSCWNFRYNLWCRGFNRIH